MDQIIPRVLRFDRFALDLTRGCLRLGDLDIDLRPKVFEVLRYLAENAGRLVSKQELVEAVWPNVAVTDNSLVQCIRELRNKLGDADHSLIKTVPRRGYLLDASMAARQSGERADQPSPHPIPVLPHASAPSPGIAQALRRCSPCVWGVAAAVVCLAVGATFLSARWLSPSTASEFFNQDDARHVAAIATDKELPLPPFEINSIDRDVLAQFRRFVESGSAAKDLSIRTANSCSFSRTSRNLKSLPGLLCAGHGRTRVWSLFQPAIPFQGAYFR